MCYTDHMKISFDPESEFDQNTTDIRLAVPNVGTETSLTTLVQLLTAGFEAQDELAVDEVAQAIEWSVWLFLNAGHPLYAGNTLNRAFGDFVGSDGIVVNPEW